MFLRIVADSFGRRPRHKLLTGAALALGMGVATAALSVSLDVGDRLAKEFRSLGANLLVTPQADSLPLEIGGVDYRPVNAGAYLPEADLPKLRRFSGITTSWHLRRYSRSALRLCRLRAKGNSGNGSRTFPSLERGPTMLSRSRTVENFRLELSRRTPGGKSMADGSQTAPWNV